MRDTAQGSEGVVGNLDAPRTVKGSQSERLSYMTNPNVHAEGPIARGLEQQTAKLPSDLFLWAAVGSILASLLFKAINKHHDSTFIGQWAPTFLLLGIYNKLVKQHGSDRVDSRASA
jgi:hypothetical protein